MRGRVLGCNCTTVTSPVLHYSIAYDTMPSTRSLSALLFSTAARRPAPGSSPGAEALQAVPPATQVEAADQALRLVALARPTPSRVSPQQERDFNGTRQTTFAGVPQRNQSPPNTNMKTTTNPSQRTEHEQAMTAGADAQHRDQMSSREAAYATPPPALSTAPSS